MRQRFAQEKCDVFFLSFCFCEQTSALRLRPLHRNWEIFWICFFFLQFFLQTKLRTYVECVCLFLYWIGMQVPLLGCDWVWKRSNVCATARTTYYVKHDKSEHSVSFALHLQCLHWAQSVVSHWTRSYRLVQIAAIAFLWIYHLHSRDICVFEKAIGEARSNK